MAELTTEGYLDLSDAEKDSEISQFEAGLAGIASGLIKVPEGVISLGAELIDLGLDTNSAAQVEQFFDKINPFEEIAEQKAAGRILEAITQVGIPGAVGFKVATKLADKALKARKANNYINFKNPNLIKAAGKASDLNRKAKAKRFAAGVTGGAAGEAFVADVERIGTFGDIFGGPTELDREVEPSSNREDASRKLFNRLKFGSESILITPFVYGTGKAIKAAATRGKNIEFSNSKLDRYFNKVFSALRARGAKPQQVFEDKMLQKGLEMADLNRATELVKQIDTSVDSMFPTIKTFFDKSANQEKVKVLKEINDAMFSGQIDKPIPNVVSDQLTETLTKKGLKPGQVNELFGSINGAREVFSDLINASSNAPKDVQTLKGLMGDRVKDYLGNTYAIFEDKSVLPFKAYTPTDEAIQNAKDLFVRYAAKKKNPITAFEAEQMVDDVVKSALEMKAPGKLPYFKYTDLTPLGNADKNKKFFKQVVTNDINGKEVSRVVGQGSKVFRELFGKIEDPRFSVYNGIQRLSAVARKNQLFQKLADDDLAVKRKVTPETPAGERGFFFDSVASAERALPYQDIVKLDDYVAPFFRDEYAVNPLAANAVNLSNNTGTIKFDNLSINTTNGSGIIANNSGTIDVKTGSIESNNGAAVDIENAKIQMAFSTLSSNNSSQSGIDLTNLSDNSEFTVNGKTQVTNPADTGIVINTVGSGSDVKFEEVEIEHCTEVYRIYQVDPEDWRTWVCDCPDYKHRRFERGESCKHIGYLVEGYYVRLQE